MDENITLNFNEELQVVEQKPAEQFQVAQQEPIEHLQPEPKKSKKWLVFLIIGMVLLLAGVGMVIVAILLPGPELISLTFPKIPSKTEDSQTYSKLTGEALADASQLLAPAYCIQTPNGTDGARPQVGLNQAGVIFEAIAEAGITRFAAIYQNPSSAVIGPIRSLRLYYLQWDTPFNCTIVHAGGADDALAALRAGGYRDLTENYAYMYRGNNGERLWNNLFTTAGDLRQFAADSGYGTSDINGFTRMTPEESKKSRVDNLVAEKLVITKPAKANTSELVPKVVSANFYFGSVGMFNVFYSYDVSTNTYKRSYGDGEPHMIYACPNEDLGEQDPENICSLQQMEPSVVIAMMVSERKASDDYHEDIDAIGSGTAYIFQNGTAIQGTWSKESWDSQIRFLDGDGKEVKLAPGQTFVSAVPNYGGVEY